MKVARWSGSVKSELELASGMTAKGRLQDLADVQRLIQEHGLNRYSERIPAACRGDGERIQDSSRPREVEDFLSLAARSFNTEFAKQLNPYVREKFLELLS